MAAAETPRSREVGERLVGLEIKMDHVHESLDILAEKIDDMSANMVTPIALKAALQEHTLQCPAMTPKPSIFSADLVKWLAILGAALLGGNAGELVKLLG
jgi:hypothetical protein